MEKNNKVGPGDEPGPSRDRNPRSPRVLRGDCVDQASNKNWKLHVTITRAKKREGLENSDKGEENDWQTDKKKFTS